MKLLDCCKSISDGDWIESEDQSSSGIRLIQTGNIGVTQYLDKQERAKYISAETFNRLKCSPVVGGDVLVSRLPDPIGRACIVPYDIGPAITAVDCSIIRVNTDIVDPKYLVYFTDSDSYKSQIASYSTGTTRKRISRKNLEKISISVPSKDKQIQIIDNLDKINFLINSLWNCLLLFDDLIRSRFIEMFGLPGTDPKCLGLESLDNLCIINPKKNADARLEDENLNISFVPMSSVSEDGTITNVETKTVRELKKGFTYFADNDVLFAKITPCMENGKGAIARDLENGIGFGSTEFHVLRPKDNCNAIWLYTLLSFPEFRTEATNHMTGSAGQRRVPAKYLASYRTVIPPISEQKLFAQFVENAEKSKFVVKFRSVHR